MHRSTHAWKLSTFDVTFTPSSLDRGTQNLPSVIWAYSDRHSTGLVAPMRAIVLGEKMSLERSCKPWDAQRAWQACQEVPHLNWDKAAADTLV